MCSARSDARTNSWPATVASVCQRTRRRRVNVLPLGAGALAGTALPIDRARHAVSAAAVALLACGGLTALLVTLVFEQLFYVRLP